MNNYNFVPLPDKTYLKSTFRININSSIDISKLVLNDENVGKDKEHYTIILTKNTVQEKKNVVVGFYSSREPNIPIVVEGGEQQAVSSFKVENGIVYFVVLIEAIGHTIKLYRVNSNTVFFLDLA